jgi:RimJ/RimL family protein N-acetyltransferase
VETVEIRAGDLLLRRWLPTDAQAVTRACQDPVLRYWAPSLPAPYTLADGRRFVAELAPQAWADRTHLGFAAVHARTGELPASVAIDDPDGRPELGYWSAPWARGRRVTEHASRALLRWAFDELGADQVAWKATVGSHASRLTGLRLGFRMIGRTPATAKHPETDAYAGAVDLRVPTDPAVGEVSFLVAPQARGRGYATAAVRALTEWGFTELGLIRVQWWAEVGNDASRRVAEKAGFTMEGLVRQGYQDDGRRRDCWIASVLSTDRVPA